MKRAFGPGLQRLSETEGIAAVEFAVIISVFLMLLLGVVEFGYDWYIKHALTNASRSGARHGVLYRTDGSGNRINPNSLPIGGWQSIQTVVTNELNGELPSAISSTITVNCTGAAITSVSPNPGDPLTVTVTVTKDWSALGSLLWPGSASSNLTIAVQSTMNLE